MRVVEVPLFEFDELCPPQITRKCVRCASCGGAGYGVRRTWPCKPCKGTGWIGHSLWYGDKPIEGPEGMVYDEQCERCS